MAKSTIKYNRNYFNTVFLTTLNNAVGIDFYNHLFNIYESVKQFVTLRETKSVSSSSTLNTDKLNLSVENYSNGLGEILTALSNGEYDNKIKTKLNFISTNFNEVIKQLELLNNKLNPLADNADRLKQLVDEIAKSYKELQAIGTKRIFSANCKEDCRVSFLSRTGNIMQAVFEENWATAQTECKNLITLANTAMQTISKCSNGIEPITDAAFKKLKNTIFNFEHM